MVLSSEPSIPGIPTQQRMPPDVEQVDNPMLMRIRLIPRTAKSKRIADRNSREVHRRYKRNHYKGVCFEATFATGEDVFVEQPPLNTSSAERLAFENYSKLQPPRLRPYGMISVGPELLKIDKDGMTNTVFNN